MKTIQRLFLMLTCLTSVSVQAQQINLGTTSIDTTTIVSGLHVGWELIYGPDNKLWVTERNGFITRVDPITRQKKRLIKIADVHEISESGLLGMALHPNFVDTPFVYVVYNYKSGSVIKEKLVRYTYAFDTLSSPLVLLDNIAGNSNHNGSRLIITADRKILMTTGDAQNTSLSQDKSKVEGKSLRMNLDGSIPSDNPFSGSRVYTFGHRNPQGLFQAPSGIVYCSEHGANTDDEINIMEAGRNYGWPTVQGFCNTSAEMTFCSANNVREPIRGWTPTIAPAGIEFYNYPDIVEFNNSLLMVTLKEADFRVLKMNQAGDVIVSETILFNNWWGRLRDVCVSPGGEVFITTSNTDGRGTPAIGDDRIIRISKTLPISVNDYLGAATANVYPSSFEDHFFLDLTNSTGVLDFCMTDVLGNEVRKMSVSETSGIVTIERQSLPAGVYFYTVSAANRKIKSGKLIAK